MRSIPSLVSFQIVDSKGGGKKKEKRVSVLSVREDTVREGRRKTATGV